MKLYDYKAEFNPRRARMFLAEKTIDVPRVQVDLMAGEHLQDNFRQINPDATVPVLELDDGLRLTETQAIARYIEGKQPKPCLLGREPEQPGGNRNVATSGRTMANRMLCQLFSPRHHRAWRRGATRIGANTTASAHKRDCCG